MKKISVSIALACLFCVSGIAQTRSRVFDNFDTTRGVDVITPTRILPNPPAKKPAQKNNQTDPFAKNSVAKNNKIKNTALVTPSLSNFPTTRLAMSAGSSLGEFTTGDDTIDSYIENSAQRYNVDPLLIYAQMHQESSFKLKATSYKGARGLMQLMPATAMRFGVTNIYDPKQNIDAGIKYMRWLLDTFNQDVNLALAGYNAGEGAVMKYGNQIPPYNETREYVRRITTRYNSIKSPYAAKTTKKVTTQQLAKMEKKEVTAPLTVYEPNALTVRLPDGRMRLVSR